MTLAINRDTLTWALAVIQPASINEIRGFLSVTLKDESVVPHGDALVIEIRELIKLNDVVKVSVKPSRYSVTRKGEQRLQKRLRHLRDQMRLFLMKNASCSKTYISSGVLDQNMDDASSSSSVGTTIQDAQRPKVSLVADQRAVWPLVSEQFQIGSVGSSDDTSHHLSFYSFGKSYFTGALHTTYELAEAIGISARLIASIRKNKPKHYRSFKMPKKTGGTRNIDAPRTFLKVIQRWINDYLLISLPLHEKCISYRKGLSIKSNASFHEKKNYILNLDIENFFGSITKKALANLLLNNGYSVELTLVLIDLCTLDNVLPQGAPTSPTLSNALLFNFDEQIEAFSNDRGVTYTRYADDITLSSDNKEILKQVEVQIAKSLQPYQLQLKSEKTRMTHISQRQIVTGLVVNERAKPSRDYRRRIRAIFHAAEKNPNGFAGMGNVLNGYIAHLSAYECLSADAMKRYQIISSKVESITVST